MLRHFHVMTKWISSRSVYKHSSNNYKTVSVYFMRWQIYSIIFHIKDIYYLMFLRYKDIFSGISIHISWDQGPEYNTEHKITHARQDQWVNIYIIHNTYIYIYIYNIYVHYYCTLYTLHCIQCTVYSVQCTKYSDRCIQLIHSAVMCIHLLTSMYVPVN